LPDSRFERGPDQAAAWAALGEIARRVAERTPGSTTEELCARLGIDPEDVRRRVAEKTEAEFDELCGRVEGEGGVAR